MPFIVEVEELKKVVRLAAGLKDASPEAQRKLHWNGVHRVIAEDDRFRLLTTDKSFFLDWEIPVVGGLNGDDFDLEIPAGQFNEMISYASTAGPFELEYLPSSNRLVFHQGQRTLRLEVTPTGPYPATPTVVESPSWSTDAQTLAKQLSFMAPIIDAMNPNVARSVATLSSSGVLTGGRPGRHATVAGLASPPSPVNLKQRSAKTLAAFLNALTGPVEVTDIPGSGGSGALLFATPDTLRSIIVPGEPRPFPDNINRLESEEHEVWKIDRKAWLHGNNIVHAVQPRGTNRLTLRIRGDGENSSMTIFSSNNPVLASHDEFQIYRLSNEEGGSDSGRRVDTTLAINADSVRESLQAMKGESMTVRYYAKHRILMIQDAAAANEPVRSIYLTFAHSTANAADTDPMSLGQEAMDAQAGSLLSPPSNPIASQVSEPAPTVNADDQAGPPTEETSAGFEEESTESNPPAFEVLEPAPTANPDDQTVTSTEAESSATLEREVTPRHDVSAKASTASSNQGETRRSRRNSSDLTAS